jgi:hypothetical protein
MYKMSEYGNLHVKLIIKNRREDDSNENHK